MYQIIKRIFDILSSTIALVILSPLLIPLVIGLKLTGEGYFGTFKREWASKIKCLISLSLPQCLKTAPIWQVDSSLQKKIHV